MFAAVGSICRGYNLLLDVAAAPRGPRGARDRRPRTEIADPDFCAKVRAALSDPDVAVVGLRSARAASRTLAWWEGEVSAAPVVHRYYEHGGGELRGLRLGRPDARRSARSTPSTASCSCCRRGRCATLRFDESLAPGHGFDVDFCLQVRAAGRKVVTADLRAIHHRSLELGRDLETLGRGAHRTSPRSGTAAGPAATPGDGLEAAAPAAPRPSARPRGRSPTRARNRLDARGARARARAWRATDGQPVVAGDRAAAARSTALRRRRARA